ncbi:SAV_2336 N-terminal domain-related protein [Streptomyces sp. MBT33]|uniref:SAV_2336 N-terminal domain-related protein n=1 Tax=Streptomyces sp. MBT33 TaxID=1488363 RepID=UPI00190C3756|nr:SAV_2336 N-terminal domain-related protein [Streptomyces sp. MBT33]MBK3645003.1 metallophosphoesterase [Streptomyces sp. MBT33]
MDVAKALEILTRRMCEAGLTPDAEALADALWLARHVPAAPARAPADRASTRRTETGTEPETGSSSAEAALAITVGRPPGGQTLREPGARPISGAAQRAGAVVPTWVPAATALPDPLALQRALRPLNRYRSSSRPEWTELDEAATAERAADTGIISPVHRREERRQARLQLVMDVSSSTVVWRDTLDDLRRICERAGSFRRVQTHYIHRDARGGARVAPRAVVGAVAHHDPGLLRDPVARQLTLVLSDCAGPLWRSGRMQRLLRDWASCAPVAVLQPLPQRMWRTTHLPAFSGELYRHEGPAGGLEFTSSRAGPRPAGALPVPVVSLRPASLGNWARLVCGDTARRLVAAAAWVRADHAATVASPRAEREINSHDRVRAFRRTASREARQLAEYLATVPLVLPVMQLVQRAMLPQSGPETMAEVLLGGLMRSSDSPTEGSYEFIDKVREELLRHLPGSEAQLVLKHSSQYVEREYGRAVRNFPALAASYLSGATAAESGADTGAEDGLLRAFAQVSAQVLARYGAVPALPPDIGPGELTDRADRLLDRYRDHGGARDLEEGIGALREALRVERRQADRHRLSSRLARALLERWRVVGSADDLREAYEFLPRLRKSDPLDLLAESEILINIAADLEAAGRDARTRPDGLARDLDDPRATPRRLALLACLEAYGRLAEMPGDAPSAVLTQSTALRATAALRAAALAVREGSAVLGPHDGDPAEWAATRFRQAAELATTHRLQDGGMRARLFEARTLLALARHEAGHGDLPWQPGPERRQRARQTADLAVTALRELLSRLVGDGAESRELALLCLDIEAALLLASDAPDSPENRREVVQVLNEALEYAGDLQELRSVCFVRLARAYERGYEATGSGEDLELAVWSGWQAAGCLSPDDPARPPLLHRLGLNLLVAEEWHDAVRVLRMAVDEAGGQDPDVSRYLVDLGDALLRRNRSQDGLSDLHEADWILGMAIRETDDDELAARAWSLRADTAERFAEHTQDWSDWETAARHLLRAADLVEGEAQARFRVRRAQALRRASSPVRAADEYRTAVLLYEEAGLGDTDDAVRARDALRTMESLRGGDE